MTYQYDSTGGRRRRYAMVIAATLLLAAAYVSGVPAGQGGLAGSPVAPTLPVGTARSTSPIQSTGSQSLRIDEIDAVARTLPRLRSLLVSRQGTLVLERYYNGTRAERPANVKSASKSVISALVGIALDRQLIPSVTTPIVTYFPGLARDPDVRKRTITVEHLLTMRPGLEGTSGRNYGAWVTSRNWVRHALDRPMFASPGVEMEYSTGNTHLLSAILTEATGKSTLQFANEVLARPLEFSFAPWPRDPQGVYFGGNDMLMTPRQMLAFGELYLRRGRAKGQQVVSSVWVSRSCEGRVRARRPFAPTGDPNNTDPMRDRQYGYGWWVYEIAGYETCFAWGYGGQYVFVVPELDVVAVTTSSPDVSEERRGHRRTLFEILERLVVRPIARAMPGSTGSVPGEE